MSILDADELELLDVVTITTRIGTQDVEVSTPTVPGCVTTVLGADGRPLDWQTRQGAGLSGMTQAYRGKGLVEFSIQIEMTAEDEPNRIALRGAWEQFDQIVEASPPGQPAKVYGIQYPTLALRGVTQCVFLNEPLLEHDKTTQIDKTVYKCREWRPPLPALSSTTSPGGSTAEGKAVDELTEKVTTVLERTTALASQAGFLRAPEGGGGS